ncbi:DUF2304 domain-containing protein [Poriferisphaera sp. WC338]|uniref:DUF2304 domain-containing protein n=1 Tax=Poriferisphaera sp. WC338 TaxID=3425129 RepID=UPI003D8169D9
MIRTLILFAFAVLLVVLTIRSLRAQRLKERYVLLFLLTGLPFLVLTFWPNGIVFFSDLLEIEKPTLLVLCACMYFIMTTFSLLSIVSVQERKITTLSQMVSILQEKQGIHSAERGQDLDLNQSNPEDESSV